MGKGKGSKGKDDWNKGKGGSNHRGVVAAPTLLAVPKPASLSCEDVPGGLHAFDRGHILSSAAELYFEVCGECRVHFAVPAPTKISLNDKETFARSGPVQLAGRNFRNIQELQSEIISLRQGHANPPRPLGPEAEKLMRGVFEYHPDAKEKLRDLQFIQVRPNPKSENPNDVTFFVMRSDQDGDDISYVKCLRAMAEQMNSGKEGEQMLPLATLVIDAMDGLHLQVPSEANHAKHLGSSSQGDVSTSVGLRLDLERFLLFVHRGKDVLGPWRLKDLEAYSYLPLVVVLDVPRAGCAIRWAAPFDLKDGCQTLDLAPSLDGPEVRLAELKNNLEALMKEQDIPGDLSALSLEEMQRIALQVLVKSVAHFAQKLFACREQEAKLGNLKSGIKP